ncbi:ABC transporter ATP-binding protein [Halovivax gelatinilyticus]|uniref:ABC transporter ATP-binding protein n=1 Tax=Halovivax gelatinilyticus TaxID=2961597 RepID=UPI0020CA76E8|nr:ABC transporter ATP-binding protein [Halovivax gelatinilyticus]
MREQSQTDVESRPPDQSLLSMENVVSGYGDVMILDEVSLRIDAGEIVALIGSNGVGKSTTTKTIGGFIPTRSGEIHFDGERIDGLDPSEIVERGIVQVPERRELFTGMSVEENLLLGGLSSEAKEKREETLERVYEIFPKLAKRTDQRAGTMSGGEQQMLALARAFMAHPRLVILDEPSMGLAPKIIEDVFDAIRQFHDEGITVFIIEQNIAQTLELAERGYVMENGRIVMEGSGDELLENDEVVERYLGM